MASSVSYGSEQGLCCVRFCDGWGLSRLLESSIVRSVRLSLKSPTLGVQLDRGEQDVERLQVPVQHGGVGLLCKYIRRVAVKEGMNGAWTKPSSCSPCGRSMWKSISLFSSVVEPSAYPTTFLLVGLLPNLLSAPTKRVQ